MDDAQREQIRRLAEENGLDPAALEAVFFSGDMPEELEQAIAAVLGDVGLFGKALEELNK